MLRHFLLPALCFLAVNVWADEQVRSVQEELRRRNIYFGDIDGRRSGELKQAVARYQKRKGFAATGQEDSETLRSLGLLARSPNEAPPEELAWPEEPVLKSDATIDVSKQAEMIAAETGVTVESIAPDVDARKAGRKSRDAVSAATPTAGSPRTARSGGGRKAQTVSPETVGALVNRYLDAVAGRDLRNELSLYADRVDYFNSGVVDRRIIERTLEDYYERWPNRKYSAAGPMRIGFNPERAEYVVTVPVNFTLKNKQQTVKGRTENRLVISAATVDPRITSIQERRIRG